VIVTTPDDFDLGGADYAALNCKNGIIACMIRDFCSVDITPVYTALHLSLEDVMTPVRRAEIAGGYIGNFDQSVWTSLFSVRWYEKDIPLDVGEFVCELREGLRRVGPFLAPHDGYFDKLAADKFERVHVVHNSMIYGVSDDSSMLRVADRHFRAEMDAGVFHKSLLAQESRLIGVVEASPFQGDWRELALRMLGSMARNPTKTAHRSLVHECVSAVGADGPGADATRWKQTYSCLKSVGVSRAFSARLVDAAQKEGVGLPNASAAELCAQLLRWADEWALVSSMSYKYMSIGRVTYLKRIEARLDALVQEEACLMPGLVAAAGGKP
jgi:hypothetical protein